MSKKKVIIEIFKFHMKESLIYKTILFLKEVLDDLNTKEEFSKWIFGHHHDDMEINDKHIVL